MFAVPHFGISTLSAVPKCLPRCFSALGPAVPVYHGVPFRVSGAARGAFRECYGGVTRNPCAYCRGPAFATASGGQTFNEDTEEKVLDSSNLSKMDALSLVGTADASPAPDKDTFVQYVVIRKDLVENLKWPLGSIISQGCHAAVAATWLHKEDIHTLQYCAPENLDSMHTVTLEVKGDTQLLNLSKKLEGAGVAHKLWVEQPENIATCLATKPYPKSQVGQFFKKLKLCK